MARIIGRNKEIKELHTLYKSNQAHSSISIIHCSCKVCPRATYPLHGLRLFYAEYAPSEQ